MKKDRRRRAREVALQILYQWEIGRVEPERAIETYFSEQWPDVTPPSDELHQFASILVRGTVSRLETIDRLIADTAERWRPERMAVVDRLILRLAIGELLRGDTAPPIVINEALELARKFSAEDSVKFINGMLDAIRKRLEAEGPGATGVEERGGSTGNRSEDR